MTYLHIDELIGVLYFLKLSNFLRFTLDHIYRKLRERNRENYMENSTFGDQELHAACIHKLRIYLSCAPGFAEGRHMKLIFTLDLHL
jgi:hypothetical protein